MSKFKEWREIKKLQKQELEKMEHSVTYDSKDRVLLQFYKSEVEESFYIDGDDDSISLDSRFKEYLKTYKDAFAYDKVAVNIDRNVKKQDAEKFERLYKSFFKYEMLMTAREIKKISKNILWCLLSGIVVIICTILFGLFVKSDWKVANIIFEIISWVLIWEGLDMLFFRRPVLIKTQHKNYNMYSAEFYQKPFEKKVKALPYKKFIKLNS